MMNSKKKEERRIRTEAFRKIELFPGTKNEFEEFSGYKTEFVDLGRSDKGVFYCDHKKNPFYYFSEKSQDKIYNSGIVALVDASYSMVKNGRRMQRVYYGVPVKRSSPEGDKRLIPESSEGVKKKTLEEEVM